MRTTRCRVTTLQFLQIFLTEALTFMILFPNPATLIAADR